MSSPVTSFPHLPCRPDLRRATGLLLGLALVSSASAVLDRPWQVLTDPTTADAARTFASPPPEYSAQFTWGWQGPVDAEVIARDLDGMKALGVYAAAIEPKTGMTHPFLSPEYFNLVDTAVAEARKRDMRIWIMDDGDYPSGLAGGKFTAERPDLRMKALAAPERVTVPAGTTFTREVGAGFVCAVGSAKTDGSAEVIEPRQGRIEWTAPTGSDAEVAIVRWVYRTMPTRSANNPANVKDTTHSLMDYLSPEANAQFAAWTFDAYQAAVGAEFGRTVLGFRGDEPAYGFNPWTPRLLEEFQRRKGYDLRPYLPSFAASPAPRLTGLTDEQRRVYADYCDVWSDLFREQYFDALARWCESHGIEMQLHVEHEEILPQLAIADGDYFKDFRHIQVPGIDIIWHQLWMDNPADFPKLASSAAHLFGRPRSMCEAFAAYRPPPDLKQARWLLDFLFSRGINRIEYMFWPASVPRGGFRPPAPAAAVASDPTPKAAPVTRPPPYYRNPGFPAVAAYVNRLSYLLGEGRPAADIGVYIPSSSFWLADAETGERINESLLAIGHELIERQRDFDYVDEQSLASVMTLRDGTFVNLSGQAYRAIIVPPALAISQAALSRLHEFEAQGGRVIFLGDLPRWAVDRTFRDARAAADLGWATFHEPTPHITTDVLAVLPPPDVALGTTVPSVSYTHRRLADSDVYFIFNSGDAPVIDQATLSGRGRAELWDASSGRRTPLEGTAANGRITVPLTIHGWSTALIVLNRGPKLTTPTDRTSSR